MVGRRATRRLEFQLVYHPRPKKLLREAAFAKGRPDLGRVRVLLPESSDLEVLLVGEGSPGRRWRGDISLLPDEGRTRNGFDVSEAGREQWGRRGGTMANRVRASSIDGAESASGTAHALIARRGRCGDILGTIIRGIRDVILWRNVVESLDGALKLGGAN